MSYVIERTERCRLSFGEARPPMTVACDPPFTSLLYFMSHTVMRLARTAIQAYQPYQRQSRGTECAIETANVKLVDQPLLPKQRYQELMTCQRSFGADPLSDLSDCGAKLLSIEQECWVLEEIDSGR